MRFLHGCYRFWIDITVALFYDVTESSAMTRARDHVHTFRRSHR